MAESVSVVSSKETRLLRFGGKSAVGAESCPHASTSEHEPLSLAGVTTAMQGDSSVAVIVIVRLRLDCTAAKYLVQRIDGSASFHHSGFQLRYRTVWGIGYRHTLVV